MSSPFDARYAAGLSRSLDAGDMTRELLNQLSEALRAAGRPPDLVFSFATHEHFEHWPAVARQLRASWEPVTLVGCLAEAIVGQVPGSPAVEIEQGPGCAIWLAWLPDTTITAGHFDVERTPEGWAFSGFETHPVAPSTLILLGDPFSFPVERLLERWREDQPEMIVLGGMASGGRRPGENRLLINDRTFDHGAVAVSLCTPLPVTPVVSQGCRPIGQPMVVTRVHENAVLELGGQPALARLTQLFRELPNQEQQCAQQGLHLGRVVSEYQERFEPGDFLIRNVLGFNQEHQAIVIADELRVGQTVQFHIRDAASADRELAVRLKRAVEQPGNALPRAALLFTCNGRGTRLFPQPHHDARAIEDAYGSIPLAGFFAQGEIGPIGGHNFLHGFTASVALFP